MNRRLSIRLASAATALALGALLLSLGCKRKPTPKTADFSQATTVSVVLGEPETEHGHGIEHAYWEKDGLTTATNLHGVPCRRLKLEGIAIGYLYFLIDSTFKKGGVKQVRIEVEYFDDKPGELGLQFDATRSRRVSNSAYTESGQIVRLRGSKTWEKAKFHVQDATFRSSQNSRSDFRLWVMPPELYVGRVAVSRGKK